LIPKLLLAAANLFYASKHRRLTVRILAVHIMEMLRDFVTRAPFEQQQFSDGRLFLFHVHWNFSESAA
jgi:hypothetical protein